MFQIVCALALEEPEVLQELEQLKGVPPNVNYLVNHGDI